MGIGDNQSNDRVQLGWVNNLLSSTVSAEYSANGPAKMLPTRTRGSGADGAFLPTEPRPFPLVGHPIVDAQHAELGRQHVALTARIMARTASTPLVGLDVTITSLDSPGNSAPESYGDLAENAAAGTLTAMELTASFSCFLCAWTENGQLVAATVDPPGRHMFMAFAKFNWDMSGRGHFTGAIPTLVAGADTRITTPVTVLAPQDADLAGCEVREPGTLDCTRWVIS